MRVFTHFTGRKIYVGDKQSKGIYFRKTCL